MEGGKQPPATTRDNEAQLAVYPCRDNRWNRRFRSVAGIRHRHPIRELIDPVRGRDKELDSRWKTEDGRRKGAPGRRGRRRTLGRTDRWASTGSPNWSIEPVMVGGRQVSSGARRGVRTWLPLADDSLHASTKRLPVSPFGLQPLRQSLSVHLSLSLVASSLPSFDDPTCTRDRNRASPAAVASSSGLSSSLHRELAFLILLLLLLPIDVTLASSCSSSSALPSPPRPPPPPPPPHRAAAP